MNFSIKLKNLRKEAKLSQEQLAEKLNVSRQAITKWETELGTPDINNLIAISSLFNISLDELMSDKKLQSPTKKYSFESETKYDIAEPKHYDISLDCTNSVTVNSYNGEQIKVKAFSDTLPNIEKSVKIKIDDIKGRIDVNLNRDDEINDSRAKDSLNIKVMLPKKYIKNIEISANAKKLVFESLSFDSLQYSGKTNHIDINGTRGRMEIDCSSDLEISCKAFEGAIEINQINATSILHMLSDTKFFTRKKGLGNKIIFHKNGLPCNNFSDENSENTIELNGIKSELTIDKTV